MFERIHNSVHIEKTAGTSLLDVYNQMYGAEKVLHFNPSTGMFHRSSDTKMLDKYGLFDQIKYRYSDSPWFPIYIILYRKLMSIGHQEQPLENFSDYKVIHGHFTAGQFRDIIPNAFMTVIMREPLDRMKSHYFNWKRVKGRTNWRINITYRPEMSFEEFAMLESLRNYQTQSLLEIPLNNFTVIGVSSNLERYYQQLRMYTGFEGNISIPMFNRSPKQTSNVLCPSDDFIREFRAYHALDYENYSKALDFSYRGKVLP